MDCDTYNRCIVCVYTIAILATFKCKVHSDVKGLHLSLNITLNTGFICNKSSKQKNKSLISIYLIV